MHHVYTYMFAHSYDTYTYSMYYAHRICMFSVCIDSYHVVRGDLCRGLKPLAMGSRTLKALTSPRRKDEGIRGMFVQTEMKWSLLSNFQLAESLLADNLAFLENFLSLPSKAIVFWPGVQDFSMLNPYIVPLANVTPSPTPPHINMSRPWRWQC